jgi:HSP20 family protein
MSLPYQNPAELERENELMDLLLEPGALDEPWAPDMDVWETKEELVITADMPGTEQKRLKVTLSGDSLIIHGRREERGDVENKQYHLVERRFGTLERIIPIPALVDVDRIRAVYKDGVLEIRMPKSTRKAPRDIQIQVQ